MKIKYCTKHRILIQHNFYAVKCIFHRRAQPNMNKNDHRKVIINAFDERYKNDINIPSPHPLPRTHIFSPCKIAVATLWRFYSCRISNRFSDCARNQGIMI